MLLFRVYLILTISPVELDTTEFNNAGYNCCNAVKARGCRLPSSLLGLSRKWDTAAQWGFSTSIF